jgi:hypothetical protein
MQSRLQSEERAPGAVWMAVALRAAGDSIMTLAAPGPRPGGLQARIAQIKVIYLRTRRNIEPGAPHAVRDAQRLPVFPHLFGLY